MINFTLAFDSAWERMVIILFRPFDLGKWFGIGFSAYLAGLLSGRNGFHSSYRNNFNLSGNGPNVSFHHMQTGVSNFFSGIQVGLIILLVMAVLVFFFAFMLLLYWLGARGQFLILDNIVRNRAAIAQPWKFYALGANQAFLFYIVFLVAALPMVVIASLVLIIPSLI